MFRRPLKTLGDLRGRLKRALSHATFVGVTGSSAKSTVAALLSHILREDARVQDQIGWNTPAALRMTMSALDQGADFVVAEIGAGMGQISAMARLLRPDMAIVTMVQLEHKSRFRSIDAVAAEKGELVAALGAGGRAVLNGDDPLVISMAKRSTAKVITFGRGEACDYRVSEVECRLPERLRLTLQHPGGPLPLQTRFVGEHFWLPTAAAATAALSLGIDTGTVARRVASFEPLFTRLGLMSVADGPDFIVDTAKAPWHSIPAAFRVLEGVSAPRRRIVLGHMSDFSGSDQKYRDAYRLARRVADQVIFVGNHSHRAKASQADREGRHFLEFKDVRTAAQFIRETAVPRELILLKGSVDLHLERIALAFESDVACWISACGKPEGCRQCGRWQIPQPRIADSPDPGRT